MRKPRKILLVEAPAVALEMRGTLLGEVVLNHPKYPLLLLASNLSNRGGDEQISAEILDLKSALPCESSRYKTIAYCCEEVSCWRVGAPFEVLEQRVQAVSVVGISANFTLERSMVAATIAAVRRCSNAFIVIGGHDATANPKFYLENGADICVLGEGETALLEICGALEENRIECVRGIAFLRDRKIMKTGKRLSHDLDRVEYPSGHLLSHLSFDQCPDGPVPMGVENRVGVIETSRGCNERCSFCDSSYIVGGYRRAGINTLRAYAERLLNAGIRTVLFADDNLLYRVLPQFGGAQGREELLQFFDFLFSRSFAWTFYNGLQVGLLEQGGIIDRELIEMLFRHRRDVHGFQGCFRAYIPLEKFTASEMKLLPKLKPLNVESEVLAAICRHHVPEINLGFIIGNIRESPDTLAETQAKASEFGALVRRASNGCSEPRFFPWCSVPIPGTPDRKLFNENIVYDESEFPELYGNYTSVLRNRYFSPLEFTSARQKLSHALNGGAERLHRVDLQLGTGN